MVMVEKLKALYPEIVAFENIALLAALGDRTPLADENISYSARRELHDALRKIDELQA